VKALDALNQKLSGIAPEMGRHAKRGAEAVEKEFSKIDPGKALRKVFDSARFNVIEEGSAKLRIFGSAIEPLGPLGIAAAAGVVALGAAFEEAHKAIEFTDSLYKAAQAAHVSTDALQEYRAAIVKAGGDANAAGPALLQFSETLGKAQEGLKGLRPFQALFGKGFSVADVKGLGGNEQALDAVVAKIQNLSSRSQQDAAIGQFGLQGLAPLILAGADAWKKYREEAKAAGLVLDADVIRRGHELSVQMDEINGKIKNDLAAAFINLGPVLVQLLGYVATMLDKIKEFTGEINKYPALGRLLGDIAAAPFRKALGQDATGPIARDTVELYKEKTTKGQFDNVGATISPAALRAALGIDAPRGKGNLADLSKTAKVKSDFDERNAAAQAEADKEAHSLAEAQAALITGIHDHADAEKKAASIARDQIFDQINKAEAATIQAAIEKKITEAQRDQLLNQYELAKAVADQVLVAKDDLTDRKAAAAALAQTTQTRDFVQAQQSRIAGNNAAEAPTAAIRNAIEKQRLLDEQKLALLNFDAQTAEERKGKSDVIDPISFDSDLGLYNRNRQKQRDALVAGQQSELGKQDFDAAGPIEKYARSVQDLNTAVQNDAVGAFQDLTSGLIDAALHAKNLGDVAKNVFLNLIQQILTQTLQKEALPGLEAAGSALLHFIPGFAGGTNSAPGGLALVGEKGPELVNLPRGASVAPTFKTLDALSAMRAPNASRPGNVTLNVNVDAGGAISQEAIEGMVYRGSQDAVRQARQLAGQDVQRGIYQANLNQ
jgi:hypothetical protein